MATITTRSGKGSALTHQEVDANFTGLNTELGQKELASNKGVANGYASLDAAGKVPSAQLPSYVDDVVEAANLASLPGTGETGKIYVTLDTNKTYRWSGSAYVEISPSPGSTDSLAEGSTNLYFTQARARASVSASGSLSYNSSTGVFSFSDAVTSVAGRTGAVTLTSSDVGLGNVENKSSATIRGELTSSNVTTALGFTPYNATNPNGYTNNTGTVTSVSGTGTVSGLTLTGTVTGSGSLTLGGTISLTSGQVTSALGYTPPQPSGTGANGTWNINVTGNAATASNSSQLNSYYSSSYSGPTSAIKQFFWESLTASGTQARTFEIARLGIDYNDWNTGIGPFEVELYEAYYSRGLKKKYVIYWGYSNVYGMQLVEYSGNGDNNFQARIGTPVQVSGDNYYLPVFVDVGYYSHVDVRVTTNRDITASNPPGIGQTFINASPSATNIASFSPDSTVNFASTTSVQIGGNQLLHAGNYGSYSLPLSGGTLTGSNSPSSPILAINVSGSGAFQRGVRMLNSGMSAGDSLMYAVGNADGARNMGQFYFYFAGAGSTANRVSMGLHSVDDVFNIFGSGNIMVGTTSDSGHKFNVSGTMNSTGALTQGGNQVLHAGNLTSYVNYGSTSSRNVYQITNWNQTTYPNAHFLSSENGVTNAPTGDFTYGLQMAFHRDGAAYRTQMVSSLYADTDIWVRNARDGDVWTSWKQLLHSGNYTSYALPLSGGTLTGAFTVNNALTTLRKNAASGAVEVAKVINSGGGYSSYIYIGANPGADWLIGKDCYGAGNDKFQIGSWNGYAYIDITYNTTSGTVNFPNNGALTVNGNQVLHAGNYSSYAFRAVTVEGGITNPAGGLNGAVQGYASYDGYSAAVPNYPNGQWWVGAFTGGNSTRGFQISGGYSDAEMYFRKGSDGWQAWRRVLTDSNYSSYALPLSGGTLTGSVTVSGNGSGLYFTGGNNRIYFGGSYRAMEGNGNGTQLQIGEGYSATYLQSANNYATTSNHLILHAGNYSSYALPLSGGTISGALTVNGTIAGGGRVLAYSTTISMSGLDSNTYYPVTIPLPASRTTRLRIQNALNSNVPSWSTHGSGFSCYIEWITNGSGWGTIAVHRRINDWRESFSNVTIVGGITQLGNSSQEVIWLRGGGNYFFSADCDVVPTIRTGYYEIYGQSVNTSSVVMNNPYDQAGGRMSYGQFHATSSMLVGSNTVLHAGNYSSYALPLSGGTMTGALTMNTSANSVAINFGDSTKSIYTSSYWLVLKSHANEGIKFRNNSDIDTFYINHGTSNYDAWFRGNVTAYSDERVKSNWKSLADGFIARLASIKSGTFDRIDYNGRQAGVSAQSIRNVLPEVVTEDREGMLSVAYGNAALVSAVELAKELVALKHKVAELEARVH